VSLLVSNWLEVVGDQGLEAFEALFVGGACQSSPKDSVNLAQTQKLIKRNSPIEVLQGSLASGGDATAQGSDFWKLSRNYQAG